jgi:hypothetical protein
MWFIKLAQILLDDEPGNLSVMQDLVAELRPRVAEAAQALLTQLGGLFGDEGQRAYVWRELDVALDSHLRQIGLSGARAEESREIRT